MRFSAGPQFLLLTEANDVTRIWHSSLCLSLYGHWCLHRTGIVSCLFYFLIYMFAAFHLFVFSAVFDHNHEVCIISAAPDIFCHIVLYHTSAYFLDISAIFMVRDTCSNTASHDINGWITAFVSKLRWYFGQPCGGSGLWPWEILLSFSLSCLLPT
jgi:hypothetical protein